MSAACIGTVVVVAFASGLPLSNFFLATFTRWEVAGAGGALFGFDTLLFLLFLWLRRSFVTLLAVFFCPDEVDFHSGSQAGRETAGLKCPKNTKIVT